MLNSAEPNEGFPARSMYVAAQKSLHAVHNLFVNVLSTDEKTFYERALDLFLNSKLPKIKLQTNVILPAFFKNM